MSLIVEKVRQEIITAIKNDRLVLPTLPEVALRVREVADDPNADLEKLYDTLDGRELSAGSLLGRRLFS